MKRSFYRAVLLEGTDTQDLQLQEDIRLLQRLCGAELLAISLYSFGTQLFLYCESNCGMEPQGMLPSLNSLLAPWPGTDGGARTWAEMAPVYLASRPDGSAVWREAHGPRQTRGMLLRLKPEMIASYVFWHYQRQEEARYVPDKYLAIALHENLLFYYDELPPIAAACQGILRTDHTPANWDALMEPHFLYWEGVDPIHRRKRPLECLLSL